MRQPMPIRARSPGCARFYSGIGARGWRNSNYFTFSVRSPALRRWIAAQLPAKPKRVLSVGCGTGELESHLSALRHRVVGLDLSRAMLKRARDRGLGRLVQGDSRQLPFGDGSFDVVIFAESIGHLHLPTAFREAARVLRGRGRLLATTYAGTVKTHAAYAKFGLDEIAGSLAAAGFRVAERRFLSAKRSAVTELPSEAGSTVVYVLAKKRSVTAPTSAAPSPG